jgi:glycosyltransferase involved in cell wall biosynthesis
MKLSIIIPAFNEQETISEVVERIYAANFNLDFEIIIVNDGSTDSTLEKIIEVQKNRSQVKLVSYDQNRGKGYAVRQGLSHSTGDIIAIQDADLEYDPRQMPRLLEPILEKRTDIVYGSRFLMQGTRNWRIAHHYMGNRFLSFMANILYGYSLSDIETGYKIFTKEVKESLELTLDDFGFEVEFLANAWRGNFRIVEMPISYEPRFWKQGKKINWKDGVKALKYMIRLRSKPRNAK